MSRIRTIKPEFWTSEQIVSCSTNARLLFIGLWNFCDDHGVHPASYLKLKAEVFPTLPLSGLKKIQDNSLNDRRALDDISLITPRIEMDNSITDRKGKDKTICEVKTSPCVVDSSFVNKTWEIYQYWQEVMQHPRAMLDKKRRNKITQALNLGYQVAELKQAINGCKETPFNMGQNERGQRYDDIDFA